MMYSFVESAVLMPDEYNAELDAKCPGTVKSLKNSNAFMDIRGKWNTSYKLSR